MLTCASPNFFSKNDALAKSLHVGILFYRVIGRAQSLLDIGNRVLFDPLQGPDVEIKYLYLQNKTTSHHCLSG